MKLKQIILPLLVFVTLTGYTTKDSDNTLTRKEIKEGWVLLFDGANTDGWRGYNMDHLPSAWKATNGTLMSAGEGGDIGGDIITEKEYENFDFMLDWKLAAEGNSGILYHIVEGPELHSTYYSGPEYQIIDDIGFPGGVGPFNSTGADYAMTPADTIMKILHPVGNWNSSRIVFDQGKVTHFLNGKKIVEFNAWSDDWNSKVESGKWKNYPNYGLAKTGYIGLQDHGSKIWFKNIKVREL